MRFVVPVLIGVIGVAILLGLGRWQIDRLAWKEGLLAEIDTRLTAAPVALPPVPDATTDDFLSVEVAGTLGARELQVLVSTKTQGAGYRLIRALETGDGRRILLDLGYVPDERRAQPRPAGAVRAIGNLRWPDDRNGATPANDVARNDWFARDLDQMAGELQTEPVLVVARSLSPDKQTQPLPSSSAGIPNDHLGYAVTWFGLAAVWAGMTGFWIWRMARRSENGDG